MSDNQIESIAKNFNHNISENTINKTDNTVNKQARVDHEATPKENTPEIPFTELPEAEQFIKFCNFIRTYINKSEEEFFNQLPENGKKHFKIKEKEICELLKNFNNKKQKQLSIYSIEKLKNFALTEYGFLKNEYRIKFFNALFMIEKADYKDKESKNISFVYKMPQDNSKYFKKLLPLYSKPIDQVQANTSAASKKSPKLISRFDHSKPVKYDNIIEVDIKRTIFNSIFNKTEEEKAMLVYMKEMLTKKVKNFFTLDESLKYYQGFHDIAIYCYIMLLNTNNPADMEEDIDIQFYEILQRLCEFYLKDYLTEISVEKRDDKGNKVVETKSSFNFQNINYIINDITKESDFPIYTLIQKKSDFPEPIYALPWALTFLTHDIKSLNLIYRIFDYILFEHPCAIYFLASNVSIFIRFRFSFSFGCSPSYSSCICLFIKIYEHL